MKDIYLDILTHHLYKSSKCIIKEITQIDILMKKLIKLLLVPHKLNLLRKLRQLAV